jgi:hypothetical protein
VQEVAPAAKNELNGLPSSHGHMNAEPMGKNAHLLCVLPGYLHVSTIVLKHDVDCQYQLMPAAESRFDAYGNKRVHSVRVKAKQGKDLPPSEGQPLEQAAPFILHRPSCCFCVHWFFFVPGRAFCTRLVALLAKASQGAWRSAQTATRKNHSGVGGFTAQPERSTEKGGEGESVLLPSAAQQPQVAWPSATLGRQSNTLVNHA